MAKINKQHKWDTCIYTLCPFGRGIALCSYGMELRGKELSVRNFPICMDKGVCLKEESEKEAKKNDLQ